MSTNPEQADEVPTTVGGPDRDGGPGPDDHLLIDPARVRRAPRIKSFLVLGGIVGAVVGLAVGLVLTQLAAANSLPVLKPGVYVSVLVAAGITFGLIIAGLVALLAERRSLRKVR